MIEHTRHFCLCFVILDSEYQAGLVSEDSTPYNDPLLKLYNSQIKSRPITTSAPLPSLQPTPIREIEESSTTSVDSAGEKQVIVIDSMTPSSTKEESSETDVNKNRSLAELLPPNSYCRDLSNRYIFPGAEVYLDSDDDDSEESDGEDDDCETEEITGVVIDSVIDEDKKEEEESLVKVLPPLSSPLLPPIENISELTTAITSISTGTTTDLGDSVHPK